MATDSTNALLKRAFLKIEELENRLNDQKRSLEPVAVVGIGCRFPGEANNPDTFWQLLVNKQDCIGPIPASRWNNNDLQSSGRGATTHSIYIDCGGFLSDDISGFDPHFFGISEREAKALDPQQRLLLETTWEALENAGQNPDELNGSRTGVFLGIASNDYEHMAVREGKLDEFNLYYLTGNAFSTASGRLSYFLGLNGPSLTIDTACSASLTAVHYACQSIWTQECTMAIAGGVNLVLSPEDLLSYCNASMISPEGRCKSFDRTADGFILSEGCGIVILKRLSDAQRDNDRIYAVIRGSAVNQDGASNGLTAPNSHAQRMLIQQALQKAGLQPSDITYIEAHGSGTPLGDPIEVQALASVFGKRNENNPLNIGCVKTNIGHCAAAAGIAGLIKTVLSIYHKKIPANLHFSDPNPLIPWNEITAQIPVKLQDWQPENGMRRAGVSSFGVSGSNAHVILEDAPQAKTTGDSRMWHMLPLSAKTESALQVVTENVCSWLTSNPDIPLADSAYTFQTGRKSFPFRKFVVADTTAAAVTALRQGSVTSGQKTFSGRSSKVIVVFPGQGAQYPGMGSELYKSEPVFREFFDQCAEYFNAYLDEDLRKIIFSGETGSNAGKLTKTLYAQPALFSLEYALARLWQSWGIQPAALMGHSIGEFAAACLAGVLTLKDAVTLVAKRSSFMQSLPPGAMLSVRASEATVLTMLSPALSIAAVNSPVLSVVSGPFDAIEEFQNRCQSAGIQYRQLNTSHAFHSAMVEPVLEDFRQLFNTIPLLKPEIPVMSTVRGTWLSDNDAVDPMYWTRHMRVTVRFSEAVTRCMEQFSNSLFLEAGPRATGTMLIRQHIHNPELHSAVASLSETGDPEGDLQQLIAATGHLWLHGVRLDMKSFYRNKKRRRTSIPTYPFERKQYWMHSGSGSGTFFINRKEIQNTSSEEVKDNSVTTVSSSVPVEENDISRQIRALIAAAVGCKPEAIDETMSFLHLGMDSLLMRQFTQQLNTIFNATISYRQLMRELSTTQSLTSFIQSNDCKVP